MFLCFASSSSDLVTLSSPLFSLFSAEVPMKRAVAGARVGLLPGRGFVLNPTVAEMEESSLDLVLAGTTEAVLMIEGFCDFLSDEQMLEVGLGCCSHLSHLLVFLL